MKEIIVYFIWIACFLFSFSWLFFRKSDVGLLNLGQMLSKKKYLKSTGEKIVNVGYLFLFIAVSVSFSSVLVNFFNLN